MYFDISRSEEAKARLHDLEYRRDVLRESIDCEDGDIEEMASELEDVLNGIDEMLEIVEEHNRIFREEDDRSYYKIVGFDEVMLAFNRLVEGRC